MGLPPEYNYDRGPVSNVNIPCNFTFNCFRNSFANDYTIVYEFVGDRDFTLVSIKIKG